MSATLRQNTARARERKKERERGGKLALHRILCFFDLIMEFYFEERQQEVAPLRAAGLTVSCDLKQQPVGRLFFFQPLPSASRHIPQPPTS